MKELIITIIGFILLFLIRIGDFVLFLFSLPVLAAQKIYRIVQLFIPPLLDNLSTQKSHVQQKTSRSYTRIGKKVKKGLAEEAGKVEKFTHSLIQIPGMVFLGISLFIKRLIAIFSTLRGKVHVPEFNPTIPWHKPQQIPVHSASKWRKSLALKHKKSKQVVTFQFPFFTRFKYFFLGSLFSLLFVFLPLLVVIFIQNLPDPKIITSGQISQTTKIYDRNKTLLFQIYASQNRTLVPLSEIPKNLQHATIAIEDKDFYKHPGFDIAAIIRSAIENASGKQLQGGSTITQQLIKSTLLTSETSLVRKMKEAILAFWAERIYSKDQILELYFNQVPYGGTAWGVEAASQIYFGKHIKDLNLAQSAFLAGIPRAPTIYSPFGSTPTVWKKRQQEVLYRMTMLGYISKQQAEDADKEELVFQSAPTPLKAPHFVMYVRDVLIKKYGLPMVEKGGLNVITSIDVNFNNSVQKIVTDEINNSAALNISNGAALVTNPKTGEVLAMIGSKDFGDPKSGNVNLTTSLRQPGSSIKPITYLAGLAQGMTAATILDDSPVVYTSPGGPSYAPVNYDGKFHGRVPLRLALANSYNIPAVKTLNQIGVPTMVDFAKKMGIKSWGEADQYGLSLTLGAAEASMVDMATVYGVLANNGVRVDVNPILKITDSKGTIIEEAEARPNSQVVDAGISFIISDILADNRARSAAFGANSILNIPGKRVSVKTGTSDNKRDNWTIGYTPNRVVTTWVGNNDNTPMSQSLASGITGAAPIWNKIMKQILQKTPVENTIVPENVLLKNCYGRTEYFIKGTESSINCNPLPTPSVSPSPNP